MSEMVLAYFAKILIFITIVAAMVGLLYIITPEKDND